MAALAFSKLFDTNNLFKRVRLDDLVVNKTVTMSKEPINNLFFVLRMTHNVFQVFKSHMILCVLHMQLKSYRFGLT